MVLYTVLYRHSDNCNYMQYVMLRLCVSMQGTQCTQCGQMTEILLMHALLLLLADSVWNAKEKVRKPSVSTASTSMTGLDSVSWPHHNCTFHQVHYGTHLDVLL